jgi:multiple sugar transport system substrate-binding protein
MKRLQKAVSLTALVTVAALGMTACSSGSPTSTPSDSASATGPVNLTWWSNLGGMDAVAAAYNASQTAIHVDFEQVPAPEAGGTQKLTDAIKAGNAPCAATVATNDLPSFVTNGSFVSLDKVDGTAIVSKFPKSSKDTVELGGKLWAYPQSVGAMTYFYRKDVFDAAGVSVPKTWDEFRTAAQKIQAAHPGTYIASFVNQDIRFITGLVAQTGDQWFSTKGGNWSVDMTGKGTAKVADYWQGLLDDGLVKSSAAGSADWNNQVTSGQLVGFLGGPFNAAGMLTLAPDQAGDWRVAVMPGWGDGATGGFGGTAIGITKGCDQREATAKFLTWLTTEPAATKARPTVGSSYPAYPAQAAAAKTTFLTPTNAAYFGGQDIYSVFDQGAAEQKPFLWGPTMPGTTAAVLDGYATITKGGTLLQVFTDAQTQTISQMKSAGLLK